MTSRHRPLLTLIGFLCGWLIHRAITRFAADNFWQALEAGVPLRQAWRRHMGQVAR